MYLPGADLGGIHYPGNRIRLDPNHRVAESRIVAFDAVESPSPLTVKKHEIDVNIRQNVMEIGETLVVMNPSRNTYVGRRGDDDSRSTLQLSVPRNFDRVTFNNEFYGRRFGIKDHRPVTDIPWSPGCRELKFTYRIPLENSAGVFRRELDLPCDDFRIRVRAQMPSKLRAICPKRTRTQTELCGTTMRCHPDMRSSCGLAHFHSRG